MLQAFFCYDRSQQLCRACSLNAVCGNCQLVTVAAMVILSLGLLEADTSFFLHAETVMFISSCMT